MLLRVTEVCSHSISCHSVFAMQEQHFKRIIEKVLIGLTNSFAYIDDLLTHSKTFEDHIQHLRYLLERLKTANIKVKTSKCKIACDNLLFLGYKISDEGVSIDDTRIKAIKTYPTPKNSSR